MEKYFLWKTWEDLINWNKFVDKNRNPKTLKFRLLFFALWVVGLWFLNPWIIGAAVLVFVLGSLFPKPYRPTAWADRFAQSGLLRLENVLCQLIAFSIYSSGFIYHRKTWIMLGFFIAGLGIIFFRRD